MDTTNNWNDEKEGKINEIKNSCQQYIIAHDNKRKSYKKLLNIITIQSIIFSVASTILSTFASYPETANFWIIITVGIISAISSGVGILIAYISPTKKLSNHIDTRNRYKHIVYQIEQEMFYERKNRKDCNEFMREICKEMLELETNGESVPIINRNDFLKEKNKSGKNKSEKKKSKENDKKIELKDIENNIDDEIINNKNKLNNNDEIHGLTKDENTDFHLLFKKMPSVNSNFTKYQMERFIR